MNGLNWSALVAEALRRRKAERLTQKEHAALADVSIPTIVAFDRGERSLSLAKAFDILRVVGLVEEPAVLNAQDVFVATSFERWRTLTAALPERSPGRFPHGWYRVDYALEGSLTKLGVRDLLKVLEETELKQMGWPLFLISKRVERAPRHDINLLECWLSPRLDASDHLRDGPAYCDFWRADPSGRMFLMRGYREDSQETLPPGTIFDTTLPLWLLAEALLHASRLASLLAKDSAEITVRLRVLFTGLTGRVLRAWGNPLNGDLLLGSHPCRTGEALLQIAVPAASIEADLARHVVALATPLFERFGLASLSLDGVDAELARMRWNKPA